MAAIRKHARPVAYDIETTGLDPYRGARIFAWATCEADGACAVHRISTEGRDERLQRFLLDRSVEQVMHNAKFELSFLAIQGYTVPEWFSFHDTMIQSQLLDNARQSNALDVLGEELLGWPTALDHTIAALGREYGDYSRIPEHLMDEYQRGDVQRTMLLHQGFYPEIEKDALLLEDYRNEMELIRVTQRMEARGVRLDINETERMIEEADQKKDQATNDAYACTHERLNLGSAKQLQWLLFTQLKYPATADVQDKTLQELALLKPHPIFDCVKRYRSYRMSGSIMRGYIERAIGDRLHPNIKTNHASTGREACDNPNLQNVSKTTKDSNPYIMPVRNCFIPSDGYGLLLSDESGIEIRLIIEAAQCRAMMELVRRGEHPHVAAIRAFRQEPGWEKTKATKSQYDTGKNGHFALAYGAAPMKVLARLGYGSLAGIAEYRRLYPEIAHLLRNGIKRVEAPGYKITTPFGRTLRIPPNEVYAWLNYEIQGTAAGIIKRAQVAAEALRSKWGDDLRLILSIHDELMHEVDVRVLRDKADRTELLKDINVCMSEIKHITVPLEAEHKMAFDRWGKAVEVKP